MTTGIPLALRRAICSIFRREPKICSRRDSYRVTLHLSAVNIGNKVALYNFLSTFSGTHFVSPRAYQAEIGFVF